MAEQRPHAAASTTPTAARAGLGGSGVSAELAVPDGWEVTEYAGKDGKPQYAVYTHGRRMASGMTSARSAARWAHMLASSHLWPII
ncbi:MAG: hypothetical protein AVDCRST_MAG77-104 [uncultured Chloroflexi bacterium]|uniref:Uncharacterized protein n=1 Tax=uncultured Chloroflexota bacterium TaxID=166587 RepID=A0A6J4H620_9CHLR|nr:MAG: hypothetical protein AVDCRST_MAG77-104 [uncultured Chloroflexota bacterium]